MSPPVAFKRSHSNVLTFETTTYHHRFKDSWSLSTFKSIKFSDSEKETGGVAAYTAFCAVMSDATIAASKFRVLQSHLG
ncbi:hypothetical protein DPMN_168082 [Dreissena polymorpha]|uniref:Uncharacterized protein n=1 Tax=Dreissena polymorpha TaxID=45954 RepID=A0A9D4F1C8_DREPO|nr:hypothetical protein DPMN_168082 [Dreissena polymorpha]